MTRTVTDAARLLGVLTRFDSTDWAALPPPACSCLDGLEDGLRGLRGAFSPNLGYVENDPEVERLVRDAVEVLADAGAEIEEIHPGFDDPVQAFRVLWYAGAAKVLEGYGADAIEQIDPALRRGIESAGEISASDYLGATAVRMELGVRMGRFHETYGGLPRRPCRSLPFPAAKKLPTAGPRKNG